MKSLSAIMLTEKLLNYRRGTMAVTYDGLWNLLTYKNMSAAELRKNTGIAPNTTTKLKKNKDAALSVLGKICKELDCNFGDSVRYILELSEKGSDV